MIEQGAKQRLLRLLGPNVRFGEPMARHTSLHVGGPADAMVRPESEDQLKTLLHWARQSGTPYMVMGAGTNLLVRDGGIRGLVIRLDRMAGDLTWEAQGGRVLIRADAGIPTRRICRIALKQGWRGFNFALGIPGTLGGAVFMNAGTAGGTVADVLEAVIFMLPTGEKVRLLRDVVDAGYRRMQFPVEAAGTEGGPGILLGVELKLTAGDHSTVWQEARMLMARRAKRQPLLELSAGCFFRNPSARQPAGLLIDEAGLKGMRIGDAQVSQRHANFIVNLGRASASEILTLAAEVQERVRSHSGVSLTPEVRIVGEEKTNPEEPV